MPLDAVRVRGDVLAERVDRSFRVAAPQAVLSDLQRSSAEPELRVGAVHAAQEELAFLVPSQSQARQPERVEHREVVRVLLRGGPQNFEGASPAALLDEDLSQLGAGAPVVRIDLDLPREARRAPQVANRLREAAQGRNGRFDIPAPTAG